MVKKSSLYSIFFFDEIFDRKRHRGQKKKGAFCLLNYIFAVFMVGSVICSLFLGTTDQLTSGLLESAEVSVSLLLTIGGGLCFWCGFMEIMRECGATSVAAKIFSPVLKHLFPNIDVKSKAFENISLNVGANFLGLGNAATPFGLAAMKEIKRLDNCGDTASDNMIIFVVLNTASIQLLPTMIGTLRAKYGSQTPFDIIPCVWISSGIALIVGVTLAKLINKRRKKL